MFTHLTGFQILQDHYKIAVNIPEKKHNLILA